MTAVARWAFSVAVLGAAGCLQEAGGGTPVTVCDPKTADCTACTTDDDCHNGVALGFSQHGWRCNGGHCAKADCKTDNDCDCSGGNTKFARGWCKPEGCFCTQCVKSSQCKAGFTCDGNRCGCKTNSDCYGGCNTSSSCDLDFLCKCAAN